MKVGLARARSTWVHARLPQQIALAQTILRDQGRRRWRGASGRRSRAPTGFARRGPAYRGETPSVRSRSSVVRPAAGVDHRPVYGKPC